MIKADRLLRIILFLAGLSMLGGLVGVFMPTAWMATTHEWLGLGHFPDTPVVEYLARGLSIMYVLLGVLFVALSTDVRRFGPVITTMVIALPVAELALAGILLARDRFLGLCLVGESAGAVLLCLVTLLLQRKLRPPPHEIRAGRRGVSGP